MSVSIPGKTWLNARQTGSAAAQALIVEPTDESERFVGLWVAVDADGPALQLTPAQCRDVARSLTQRADLIDGGRMTAAEIFTREEVGLP